MLISVMVATLWVLDMWQVFGMEAAALFACLLIIWSRFLPQDTI
jgi:hypothetical protein